MAHNLDFSNNRANMAFTGDRGAIWHGLGAAMPEGQSIDAWQRAAGLDWTAVKCPAIAALEAGEFASLPAEKRLVDSGLYFNVRSDTSAVISPALSDRHINVQPRETLEFFQQYISADSRFVMDTAGSLRGGSLIWGMAKYNGDVTVAGDAHKARLLMTTTFDGTGSTTVKMTMVRVVCNNTLDAALGDKGRAEVKTRHNTRFDAKRAGAELAELAQAVDRYKMIGDALAGVTMPDREISEFFKLCLDIPLEAKKDAISTRKLNQFADLTRAYGTTRRETDGNTAWAALNAVTRFVDHDRAVRISDGASAQESRVLSAQFGSGAALKGKAMQLLMPRIRDLVPVAA